nr:DUF5682 family protein [Pseudomarimonas arenosa]
MREFKPNWVLIEGPSDFNDRIGELQNSEHQAPIAIFSYYTEARHTRHCFAPFADNSPEWVALQGAEQLRATTRFIDLPYWHEGSRGRANVLADALSQRRQQQGEQELARRLGLDDGDALWDHLFEQELPLEPLAERLELYFDRLRGEDPGDASDRAREAYMAAWIRHAMQQGGRILVVCGGWHRPALLRLSAQSNSNDTLALDVPASIERHGSFLIPYSDRRLEALAGYGAGVQSPAYYRRLYQQGAEAAADWAERTIVTRLRKQQQTISTASLIAAQARTQLLAKLRGHPTPLRADVLDGLLDAICNEALSAPPPWQSRGTLSMRDDPMLREALLALTGERVGILAPGTPLPPLVFDTRALLEALKLDGSGGLKLDRLSDHDRQRSEVLWRLRLLGIPGFEFRGSSAPQAARQLGTDQRPIEEWQLSPSDARDLALIEAGAYGPTLAAAALQKLGERLSDSADIETLAELYANALRAGYAEFGDALLPDLHAAVLSCADHGSLARAGLRLHNLLLCEHGSGEHSLLLPALNAMLDRLLWLLEGLSAPIQPAHVDDTDPLRLIDRLLDSDLELTSSCRSVLDTLQRLSLNIQLPPATRGACFAVCWRRDGDAAVEQRLLGCVRAFAGAEQLGDFLFGLFALARNECAGSSSLLTVLDAAVAALSDQDFLIAAPSLRQAFHYFPPRERAAIGRKIAGLHGKDDLAAGDWLRLPCSIEDLQRSARLSQAVDQLRQRFAL